MYKMSLATLAEIRSVWLKQRLPNTGFANGNGISKNCDDKQEWVPN